MGDSEQTAATGSTGERQPNVFDAWLGLYTGGISAQANTMRALTRATVRTSQLLQRQNEALAQSWMRTATGTESTRTPISSGSTGQSEPADPPPTDEQRQGTSDESATTREMARTRATEATDFQIQQPTAEEQPSETTSESGGRVLTATAGRSKTGAQEQRDSARSTPPTDAERIDAASDLDQLRTLGPVAAERLRSADVHTIEELARARTKKLAAETGLHPRRVRVWVFRARRMSDR